MQMIDRANLRIGLVGVTAPSPGEGIAARPDSADPPVPVRAGPAGRGGRGDRALARWSAPASALRALR